MISKKFQFIVVILTTFSLFLFTDSFAEEPILISFSTDRQNVVFDGKWTDGFEWKQGSWNQFSFDDGSIIHLRSSHQGDFIYLHVNFATDTVIDKGSDSAIVCFDTKNDKSKIPQSDDYCFSTSLYRQQSFTYQGSNTPAINGYFKKIDNHEDFVAVGSASGKFDRYNLYPHASYEFKIPLDVIGRSDNYGFYLSVYDGHSEKNYSWPYSIVKKNIQSIQSPSTWGDMISPDKSLPEFNSSIMLLIIPFMIIFVLFTKSNLVKLQIFKN